MPRKHPGVDVCDFGAVADGETDNTAAVQAALDEAQERGADLYLPSPRPGVGEPGEG